MHLRVRAAGTLDIVRDVVARGFMGRALAAEVMRLTGLPYRTRNF